MRPRPADNDDRYTGQRNSVHGSRTFHEYRESLIAGLLQEREDLEQQCFREEERGDKYKKKYHDEVDGHARIRREHQEQAKEITKLQQQLEYKTREMD